MRPWGNISCRGICRRLSTFWPPLFPLLVGLSSLVFRDIETGGKFVSVLAGSVLVVPVYSLIRVLYGKDAAFIGAFLVCHPPDIDPLLDAPLNRVYLYNFISDRIVRRTESVFGRCLRGLLLRRDNARSLLFTQTRSHWLRVLDGGLDVVCVALG